MATEHIDTTARYSFERILHSPGESVDYAKSKGLETTYIHSGKAVFEVRDLGKMQAFEISEGQGFVVSPGVEYRLSSPQEYVAYRASSEVKSGPIIEIIDDGINKSEVSLGRFKLILNPKKVTKPWGHELWIIWTRDYHVLKQIMMTAGNRCSLQVHRKKFETNYIEHGEANLIEGFRVNPEAGAEEMQASLIGIDLAKYIRKCGKGSKWTANPGIVHRVISVVDYLAYEVSTPELDDVVRLQDDSHRTSGRIESEHRASDETDDFLHLYTHEKAELLKNYPISDIKKAVELVWSAYQDGGTIFAMGNGGNAAYVANMITDLSMHPFVSEDKSKPLPEGIKRLRAINLAESPATITAILNDIGPDHIFSQQLINHMVKKGDVVFGFTGSGNSKNVLVALETAKLYGAKTVAITRGNGGKAKAVADLTIIIPGTSKFPGQTGGNDFNFHFEDSLSSIAHMITGIVKYRINRAYL